MPKSVQYVLAGAVLVVLIAAGVMWVVRVNAPVGPRPGVDIPMRGM